MLVLPSISLINAISPLIANGYLPINITANIYNFPRLTGACFWSVDARHVRIFANRITSLQNFTVSSKLEPGNLIKTTLTYNQPLHDESIGFEITCSAFTDHNVIAIAHLNITAKGKKREKQVLGYVLHDCIGF